ncbi:hypothetical protein [Ligilactobacillus aviarius]|uniref:Uncharacterized protein n=1 Tax=Ligilactobacillus aviarius TaxID=1606 RepID=A0A510WS27_9LACO|nr:hypothetical protein [Ligilactobacillus aviarius]KRM39642.1 hypothetical protein FC33_GL000656 [Ligilactobacillus aviarius subsp. aviarius DSM 20655]GEK42023.1 hypothetical protein LAV01_08550 [Ligilactobacillus aviarius]
MNGIRKKNQKTILDATFEESRKLVDESYVEEALKVSSNKQDRNRFWGEVVMILFGTISIIIFTHLPVTNSNFDKKLMWTQFIFNFLVVCNLILTSIFILYALISKIKIRKNKFLRDYDFNQKMIVGFGISCIFIAIIMLPITASCLHSVIFEPLYIIIDVVISYKIIIKLYGEEMAVLYGSAYQNHRAKKASKIADWISKNIIVLGAILFVIKDLFSGLKDIQEVLLTIFAPLLFMALWWILLWFYFEKTLKGYYLKKYSEQYRQLYGYSRDEWYGDKVDDWNRMKTIEKHLKLKEEERKVKQKINRDVKGKSEDEE